ncbi:MAG: NADP-dependent oxidoreductase [Pseudomonadota bacterium]
MKKVIINSFGGPDVLEFVSTPLPKADKQQALVKVHDIGINPIDHKIRDGSSFVAKQLADKLPIGLGYEISGEIVEIDDNQAFKKGDRVCGLVGFLLNPCAYAEYAAADLTAITKIPDKISYAQAACLPIAGLTALQALNLFGNLQDKKLLIQGGGGGVGHLAVQLAKIKGAEVITTASAQKYPFLYDLGADQCIDYKTQSIDTLISDIDGVLDLIGGQTGIHSLSVLKPSGLLVTIPTITSEEVCQAAEKTGIKATKMVVKPDITMLNELLDQLAKGDIELHISEIFPLSNVAQAHEHLDKGNTKGKLCLSCYCQLDQNES